MKSKSTYSLLLNAEAEDKGRSIFEAAVYAVVVLSMAVSGWHFATSKLTLPGPNRQPISEQSMLAKTPVEQPLVEARG